MFDLPVSAILFSNSARGVYIPQHFAESVNRYSIANWSSWLSDLDALCKGPDDCEYYWEIWEDMLNRLELRDSSTDIEYRLYQDGDLWLVPTDWDSESDESESDCD